jgi:hypothetical protein
MWVNIRMAIKLPVERSTAATTSHTPKPATPRQIRVGDLLRRDSPAFTLISRIVSLRRFSPTLASSSSAKELRALNSYATSSTQPAFEVRIVFEEIVLGTGDLALQISYDVGAFVHPLYAAILILDAKTRNLRLTATLE